MRIMKKDGMRGIKRVMVGVLIVVVMGCNVGGSERRRERR
ncbi:hypothetical protein BCD_1841 (plasmid) [Borrelia crocidurae DOU]|uniref:Uncharacterized protein n=1 Tax=Borrelia crocidurae DOU TaxID=1293575 RepID=W5SLZ2_9SPIR|nr:hypothetical protein BCD_1841 [Borrelia crocidurae DOU]